MLERIKFFRFLVAFSLLLNFVDGSQRSVFLRLPNPLESIGGLFSDNNLSAGFYYGITREVIGSFLKSRPVRTVARKAPSLKQIASTRHKEFETIGKDVELWAEELFSSKGGWKEIECHPALKRKFNPLGKTQQFVKWMKDPRGRHGNPKDMQCHPCMKLHAVIDAPFALVCRYLSQEHRYREYNSLLVDQKDVEELTPHSKICWSQSKKLCALQIPLVILCLRARP